MSRTSFLVAVLALAAWPSVASANLTATVGAFGTQHTQTTAMPNLVSQPVGAVDCNTEIPITFTGLTAGTTLTTRYIQVWSAAAASANCGTPTSRTSAGTPACTIVNLPADSTSYMTGQMSFEMRVTPLQLFGSCASGQRSFFFFDVSGTAPDVSTMFGAGAYYELDIAIDATAPPQPVLAGPAAGDGTVTIDWTASDTGLAPSVSVFFDPNGCGGDGGAMSSTLIAGSPQPSSGRIYGPTAGANTATIPITNFTGWTSTTYGQTGAIAITVTDTAGNVSVLSNVVCVSHVVVTGFWEQYCAEHGMTVAQCTANYHGCSVALPGRRTDLGAIAALAAVLGLLFARRTRREQR
jgi:hypothetical protein